MADQNITALPATTTPASTDQLLLVGADEEKLIDYDKLADAILTKLTSKTFALDQGTKTLLQALNELNSNSHLGTLNDNIAEYLSKTNSVATTYFVWGNIGGLYPSWAWGTLLCSTDNTANFIGIANGDKTAAFAHYENGTWEKVPVESLSNLTTTNKSSLVDAINEVNSKSLLLKFVIPFKIEIGKYININGDSIDYEPYCIIYVPVRAGQKAMFTNVSNNDNTRHELWNASTNERLSFSNANYNGTYSVDVPSSETNYYVKLSVFKDSGLPRQLQ